MLITSQPSDPSPAPKRPSIVLYKLLIIVLSLANSYPMSKLYVGVCEARDCSNW